MLIAELPGNLLAEYIRLHGQVTEETSLGFMGRRLGTKVFAAMLAGRFGAYLL
jgi:hypothetical protein